MTADDLPARIRAARAYVDMNQDPFAKVIGSNRNRLRELESGSGEPPRANELALIARHSGLPEEFFTVDLQALGEPVSADDLFASLARIEGSIEEGMTMLRGLANEDMIRRILPGGGEQS